MIWLYGFSFLLSILGFFAAILLGIFNYRATKKSSPPLLVKGRWVAVISAILFIWPFFNGVVLPEPDLLTADACINKIRDRIATKSTFKVINTFHHRVIPLSYDEFIIRYAYLTRKMDYQEWLDLETDVLFEGKPLPLNLASRYYSLMPDRTANYDIGIWFVEYDAQNLYGAEVRNQGYCGYLIKNGVEGGDVIFWDLTAPNFPSRQAMKIGSG